MLRCRGSRRSRRMMIKPFQRQLADDFSIRKQRRTAGGANPDARLGVSRARQEHIACTSRDQRALGQRTSKSAPPGRASPVEIAHARGAGKNRGRAGDLRDAGKRTHLLPWGCHTIMELVLAALPVETAGALLRTGATAERAAMVITCG
jgi:hypothetical protein